MVERRAARHRREPALRESEQRQRFRPGALAAGPHRFRSGRGHRRRRSGAGRDSAALFNAGRSGPFRPDGSGRHARSRSHAGGRVAAAGRRPRHRPCRLGEARRFGGARRFGRIVRSRRAPAGGGADAEQARRQPEGTEPVGRRNGERRRRTFRRRYRGRRSEAAGGGASAGLSGRLRGRIRGARIGAFAGALQRIHAAEPGRQALAGARGRRGGRHPLRSARGRAARRRCAGETRLAQDQGGGARFRQARHSARMGRRAPGLARLAGARHRHRRRRARRLHPQRHHRRRRHRGVREGRRGTCAVADGNAAAQCGRPGAGARSAETPRRRAVRPAGMAGKQSRLRRGRLAPRQPAGRTGRARRALRRLADQPRRATQGDGTGRGRGAVARGPVDSRFRCFRGGALRRVLVVAAFSSLRARSRLLRSRSARARVRSGRRSGRGQCGDAPRQPQ